MTDPQSQILGVPPITDLVTVRGIYCNSDEQPRLWVRSGSDSRQRPWKGASAFLPVAFFIDDDGGWCPITQDHAADPKYPARVQLSWVYKDHVARGHHSYVLGGGAPVAMCTLYVAAPTEDMRVVELVRPGEHDGRAIARRIANVIAMTPEEETHHRLQVRAHLFDATPTTIHSCAGLQ